jgi:hypothetical protein
MNTKKTPYNFGKCEDPPAVSEVEKKAFRNGTLSKKNKTRHPGKCFRKDGCVFFKMVEGTPPSGKFVSYALTHKKHLITTL